MELFDALHTRRSIRKYQQKAIPDELVHKLLAAAMMAPSAGDERPWHFLLVTDPEKKEQVKAAHPHAGMMVNAPLGILICGDLNKQKYEGFWPQDCSAAMQNLLLAAHASGLGAVWTGIHPLEERVEKFQHIFNLPKHIVPFGLAVMGWPDQSSKVQDRFDPSRVHLNTLGRYERDPLSRVLHAFPCSKPGTELWMFKHPASTYFHEPFWSVYYVCPVYSLHLKRCHPAKPNRHPADVPIFGHRRHAQ